MAEDSKREWHRRASKNMMEQRAVIWRLTVANIFSFVGTVACSILILDLDS